MNTLRPARILYVNHTGQVSGAERVLLNMVRGLARTRYEPVVASPGGRLVEMVERENVPHVRIPPVQARFNWRLDLLWKAALSVGNAVFILRRTIVRLQPEIVHANTVRAGIVASFATVGTRAKLIWHIHDTLPRHPISTAIRLLAFFSRPDRIIAVSDAVAKAFRGRLGFAERLTTIHNGTELKKFPAKGNGSKRFRLTIGVPEDAFMVCALGQVCARKGQVELVEGFKQICALAPRMHLVIAGSLIFEHERRYLDALRLAAADPKCDGRVHLVGEIHNVSALLQAADLLVLNSLDEPFGLVLVEAMASGTPVLATRTGGVPEIVQDGRNGWLVEPEDTNALAQKLLELAQDQCRLDKAAAAALLETCHRFSLERFQMKVQGLYEELVPQKEWPVCEQSEPVIARGSVGQ